MNVFIITFKRDPNHISCKSQLFTPKQISYLSPNLVALLKKHWSKQHTGFLSEFEFIYFGC